MLRNEEHKRLSTDLPLPPDSSQDSKITESTALSKLTAEEFLHLRTNYVKLTPYVRLLFCFLAVFALIWDLMLFCTILYFHIMIEKVVASCIAVVLWFVLYRGIYTTSWSSLFRLPGFEGPFKYVTYKTKNEKLSKKESLNRGRAEGKKATRGDDLPKFMGMPLYGLAKPSAQTLDEEVNGKVINDVQPSTSFKTTRSRSASRTGLPRGSSKSSLNLKYL